MNKYDVIPENIEIANLGSSHGFHSFDYTIKGFSDKTSFNFAIGQQTLDFDMGLLKQYINNFKEKSTLIICLSPFETNGVPDYQTNKDVQFRYYGFLKQENFPDFSFHDWVYFNYLALFTSKHPAKDIKNSVAEYFKFSKKNAGMHSAVSAPAVQVEKQKTYADVSNEEKAFQSKEILEVWKKIFPPRPDGNNYNLNCLDQMIQLCRERKINAVITTTPISREVFDELKVQGIYSDLDLFYKEMEVRYPDAKLLNYLNLFFDRNELFKDNNHLNADGAREFSRILHSDLVGYGLINQE